MENMMMMNMKMKNHQSNINKDSHTISKAKPKIRIIHIFAPEIIKTDVANFRELVQRLTGKPAHHQQKGSSNFCKKKPRNICTRSSSPSTSDDRLSTEEPAAAAAKKMEVIRTGFDFAGCLETRERERERAVVKEEVEAGLWQHSINGGGHGDHHHHHQNHGGFLTGFGDFDGFIQELGEFPLFPLDASHHLHGFEEPQLA